MSSTAGLQGLHGQPKINSGVFLTPSLRIGHGFPHGLGGRGLPLGSSLRRTHLGSLVGHLLNHVVEEIAGRVGGKVGGEIGLEGDKVLARPARGAVQRGRNAFSCRELALSSHLFRRGLEPSSPRFLFHFLLTPFLFEDIRPTPLLISKKLWAGGVLSPLRYTSTQCACEVKPCRLVRKRATVGMQVYLDVSGCIWMYLEGISAWEIFFAREKQPPRRGFPPGRISLRLVLERSSTDNPG